MIKNGYVYFSQPDGWLTHLSKVGSTSPGTGGNDLIKLGDGNDIVVGGTVPTPSSAATATRSSSATTARSPGSAACSARSSARTTAVSLGNTYANQITLGDGNNIVFGGSGDNTIVLGAGNDIVAAANGQLDFIDGVPPRLQSTLQRIWRREHGHHRDGQRRGHRGPRCRARLRSARLRGRSRLGSATYDPEPAPGRSTRSTPPPVRRPPPAGSGGRARHAVTPTVIPGRRVTRDRRPELGSGATPVLTPAPGSCRVTTPIAQGQAQAQAQAEAQGQAEAQAEAEAQGQGQAEAQGQGQAEAQGQAKHKTKPKQPAPP